MSASKPIPTSEVGICARFWVIPATPSANCGIANTKHASIEQSAQPYPRIGEMRAFISSIGRSFTDSVTYDIAASITMPKIIASGCSHIKPTPPKTPRYSAEASDPPPRVVALWSHPGPENLAKVFKVAQVPCSRACTSCWRWASSLGLPIIFPIVCPS